MIERFASESDLWLQIVIWGSLLISIVAVAPLMISDGRWVVKILTLLILVPSMGLVFWVSLGTYYLVDDELLSVRSGPFRWDIPISDIHKITPTRNSQSSPALSLNRLLIEYGDDQRVMISPERRDQFLKILEVSHR